MKIAAPPLAQNVHETSNAGPTTSVTTSKEEKTKKDAAKVGRDFEAILVRQMLSTTKIGGKGGYADMAVESLANAVTSAGGLGMGRAIEDAINKATHAHTPPASAPDPTKKVIAGPQVSPAPAVRKTAE